MKIPEKSLTNAAAVFRGTKGHTNKWILQSMVSGIPLAKKEPECGIRVFILCYTALYYVILYYSTVYYAVLFYIRMYDPCIYVVFRSPIVWSLARVSRLPSWSAGCSACEGAPRDAKGTQMGQPAFWHLGFEDLTAGAGLQGEVLSSNVC